MTRPAKLQSVTAPADIDATDEAIAVEGFAPLLPEGLWLEAKFIGHETARIFNAAKIFLRFEVVELGPYKGLQLFRAFRIRRLVGRPGPNGKFVLGARSDLYVVLVRLLDVKLRTDRVSLRDLRRMLFCVQTRTVRTNHAGQSLPDDLQYTVIDRIERGE